MSQPLSQQAAQWWRTCQISLGDLLYPASCVGCSEEFSRELASGEFCPACIEKLAWGYADACPRCAMPGVAQSGCQECQQRQHRFELALALGKYEGMLRQFVLRAKTSADDALALALGERLAQHWEQCFSARPLDGVVAVPGTWVGRITRRTNLPELLAERVAARLRTPSLSGAVAFTRAVQKQHNLTRTRRERNLRHALTTTAAYDIKGTHLLVIDDVLTTGATANEMARALLAAGSASVAVAVVARGIGLG